MWLSDRNFIAPSTMKEDFLRFNGTKPYDPAIDSWFEQRDSQLGAIARQWFEAMRRCGDEVREVLHDGCPTACFGDAPFGYVNVFKSHVNVGFFHGASLRDPKRLLQGDGKRMRHVKLKPEGSIDADALSKLIDAAWQDIRTRVENS